MLTNAPVTTAAEARALIAELGRRFYALGWASGTGGGISLRLGDRVFMAPSGIQKEAIDEASIYELDQAGNVTRGPPEESGLKVSECRPLFLHAFQKRDAGAVIHSHSKSAVLATLMFGDVFRTSHLEMQKGITGHSYGDVLEVPIIENTPREHQLADTLADAMDAFPKAQAVLVRRHGVYVWGRDWREAKRHAECYDYLFATAVEMKRLGLDPAAAPPAN